MSIAAVESLPLLFEPAALHNLLRIVRQPSGVREYLDSLTKGDTKIFGFITAVKDCQGQPTHCTLGGFGMGKVFMPVTAAKTLRDQFYDKIVTDSWRGKVTCLTENIIPGLMFPMFFDLDIKNPKPFIDDAALFARFLQILFGEAVRWLGTISKRESVKSTVAVIVLGSGLLKPASETRKAGVHLIFKTDEMPAWGSVTKERAALIAYNVLRVVQDKLPDAADWEDIIDMNVYKSNANGLRMAYQHKHSPCPNKAVCVPAVKQIKDTFERSVIAKSANDWEAHQRTLQYSCTDCAGYGFCVASDCSMYKPMYMISDVGTLFPYWNCLSYDQGTDALKRASLHWSYNNKNFRYEPDTKLLVLAADFKHTPLPSDWDSCTTSSKKQRIDTATVVDGAEVAISTDVASVTSVLVTSVSEEIKVQVLGDFHCTNIKVTPMFLPDYSAISHYFVDRKGSDSGVCRNPAFNRVHDNQRNYVVINKGGIYIKCRSRECSNWNERCGEMSQEHLRLLKMPTHEPLIVLEEETPTMATVSTAPYTETLPQISASAVVAGRISVDLGPASPDFEAQSLERIRAAHPRFEDAIITSRFSKNQHGESYEVSQIYCMNNKSSHTKYKKTKSGSGEMISVNTTFQCRSRGVQQVCYECGTIDAAGKTTPWKSEMFPLRPSVGVAADTEVAVSTLMVPHQLEFLKTFLEELLSSESTRHPIGAAFTTPEAEIDALCDLLSITRLERPFAFTTVPRLVKLGRAPGDHFALKLHGPGVRERIMLSPMSPYTASKPLALDVRKKLAEAYHAVYLCDVHKTENAAVEGKPPSSSYSYGPWRALKCSFPPHIFECDGVSASDSSLVYGILNNMYDENARRLFVHRFQIQHDSIVTREAHGLATMYRYRTTGAYGPHRLATLNAMAENVKEITLKIFGAGSAYITAIDSLLTMKFLMSVSATLTANKPLEVYNCSLDTIHGVHSIVCPDPSSSDGVTVVNWGMHPSSFITIPKDKQRLRASFTESDNGGTGIGIGKPMITKAPWKKDPLKTLHPEIALHLYLLLARYPGSGAFEVYTEFLVTGCGTDPSEILLKYYDLAKASNDDFRMNAWNQVMMIGETLGHTITAEATCKSLSMLIFMGGTNTTKSSYIKIYGRLLGDYAIIDSPALWWSDAPTANGADPVTLTHDAKRMIVSTELSDSIPLNEAKLNAVFGEYKGGCSLTARTLNCPTLHHVHIPGVAWCSLNPSKPDPVTGITPRSITREKVGVCERVACAKAVRAVIDIDDDLWDRTAVHDTMLNVDEQTMWDDTPVAKTDLALEREFPVIKAFADGDKRLNVPVNTALAVFMGTDIDCQSGGLVFMMCLSRAFATRRDQLPVNPRFPVPFPKEFRVKTSSTYKKAACLKQDIEMAALTSPYVNMFCKRIAKPPFADILGFNVDKERYIEQCKSYNWKTLVKDILPVDLAIRGQVDRMRLELGNPVIMAAIRACLGMTGEEYISLVTPGSGGAFVWGVVSVDAEYAKITNSATVPSGGN